MTAPALDHLIMLVPDSSPSALSWISSKGFTIVPGGTHADGLTCNSLVLLSDGVYLEFISFTLDCPPAKKAAHWWSSKRPNEWSDWCLSPHPHSLASRLSSINRPSSGEEVKEYDDPQEGGRKRPDGTELRWRVAFPNIDSLRAARDEKRGKMPFWCEDVTDRSLRVPIDDETTKHENGVTGVAEVVVLVSSQQAKADLERRLGRVLQNDELTMARVIGQGQGRVSIRIAETEEERQHTADNGEGIYQVHFDSSRGRVLI